MSEQYLTILLESLYKKIDVLDEILRICQKQSEILALETFDFEAFDACVDDKDVCIEQLNKLDENFETVYQRVAQELKGNKQRYASWIKECQDLITRITDKSMEIQAHEMRNKQAVEAHLRRERKSFGQGRRSAEVAMGYYRTMSNTGMVQSQFMDQKK